MMKRKNDIHTEIEELMTQKSSLWPDELARVEDHLDTCEQCQSYALFLEEIHDRDWNPYTAEAMSSEEKQDVLKRIETEQAKSAGQADQSLARLGRALSAFAALVLLGLVSIILFTSTPDDFSIEFFDRTPDFERDYDGWEMGVAFDIPDEWDHQINFVIEGYDFGNVMGLGSQPITGEELLSPWVLQDGETRAQISVKNPKFDLSGDIEEHMHEFSGFFNGYDVRYELVDFAGRQAYFLKSGYQDREYIDATFLVGDRLARIYVEGRPDENGDLPDIDGMAEFVAASMVEVTYDGWKVWEDKEIDLHLAIPINWSVADNIPGQSLFIFEENTEIKGDWQIWYDGPEDAPKWTDDELRAHFATYLDDSNFDVLEKNHVGLEFPAALLVENLSDQLSDPLRKMSLYETEAGNYLLVAVMPNTVQISRAPLLTMTLEFEKSELNRVRSSFEQVFRTIRPTAVPLIVPNELEEDPHYGQLGVERNLPRSYDYGTEMIYDFEEFEIKIDSIRPAEDRTKIAFYVNDLHTNPPFFLASPFEGQLVDRFGETYLYKSGSFSSASRPDNEGYNPPNELTVAGNVDLAPSSTFTISTNMIVYNIGSTHNIEVDLAGHNWGDRWLIEGSTYFNGAFVNFYEAWLDEESNQLKLVGLVNGENVPYPIKNLYHTQFSQAKLKFDGERVDLTYDLDELKNENVSIYLEATIQYENALSTSFQVGENGEFIPVEN